jgi:hypothetical protein
MAYAPHRSAIDELHRGMTEGSYAQGWHNDRGGVLDPATARARRDLESQRWHPNAMTDPVVVELPDGRSCVQEHV